MRVLLGFVVLMTCIPRGYASTSADVGPVPSPVATLDLTSLLPHGPAELDWTTISFVSENSIAVGLCSKGKPDRFPSPSSVGKVESFDRLRKRWPTKPTPLFIPPRMAQSSLLVIPLASQRCIPQTCLSRSICRRAFLWSLPLEARAPPRLGEVGPLIVYQIGWNCCRRVMGFCTPSRMIWRCSTFSEPYTQKRSTERPLAHFAVQNCVPTASRFWTATGSSWLPVCGIRPSSISQATNS